MATLIRSLLTSKKFVTAISATIAAALMRLGFDVDGSTVFEILSPILLYLLGQGLADIGKHAGQG